MYIIINALKNVKRNLSRNILMLIILVLVIVGSVVALSIKNATATISQQYRDQIGAEASIELDQEKFKGTKRQPTPITMDMYTKLSQSEFVKSYSLFASMAVENENLKGVGEKEEKNTGDNQSAMVGLDSGGNAKEMGMPSLKLHGVAGSGGNQMPDFQSNLRSISQGRGLENDNEALISEELAELNNLKVGDTIKLKNPLNNSDTYVELKIVGLYKDLTKEYPDSGFEAAFMNRRNEILTTFSTIRNLDEAKNLTIASSFQLNSPKELEGFTKLARELGITDDYKITTDEVAYQKAVGPLESLNSIMTYFIIIMLVVAAGVLLLLSFLSIRERQYEIGVLRAMGMKKRSVALGFITESITILLISLMVGIGIGSVISNPIANDLLKQQITNLQEAEKKNQNNGSVNMVFKDNIKEVKTVDKIDANINVRVILQIAGIGLVLVLISNLAAVSYITKFEPIEIMRKKD